MARGGTDLRRAAALALLLCLALAPRSSDASHFRYGSISWRPSAATAALPDGATGGPFEAEFNMQLAFRRDYTWGAYFKEGWRSNPNDEWSRLPMPELPYECMPDAKIQCFLPGESDGSSLREYLSGNYQIIFPAGMASNGYDLMPNTDGLNFYNPDGTRNPGADAENTGGRVCVSPQNKGYDGDWDATGPFTIGQSPEVAPFYADSSPYPGEVYQINKCTPWSQVFGFFFGDDNATHHSAFNEGVVAEVTDMSFENTEFGNYVRMRAVSCTHTYTAPMHAATNKPYVAFFTGGNRIDQLHNNANGRYRLEVEVAFVKPFSNRSPIATNIPVLPLPYVDSDATTAGILFQIAAYDPDLDDTIRYFLGTTEEYGGVQGNVMWETDNDNFTAIVYNWYEDVYNVEGCNRRQLPASVCTDPVAVGATIAGENTATNYAPDLTKVQYPVWSDATHLPHSPPNLSIDPKSGTVTWKVGKDPWTAAADGTVNTPVTPGFYNLVVMVEERLGGVAEDLNGGATTRGNGIKVPLDFLLYLYPAAHMCSSDCDVGELTANMTTLETDKGYYGDAVAGSRPYVDGDPFTGLFGPGTGECKLCGGGGVGVQLYGGYNRPKIVEYMRDSVKNTTKYCVPKRESTGMAVKSCCYQGGNDVEYGTVSASGFAYPLPTGYAFTGCLGAGTADSSVPIVPYEGELDACLINTRPFFLTKDTVSPRPGTTPALPNPFAPLAEDRLEDGLFKGMFEPAVVQFPLGIDVSFELEAHDPDHCVELQIGDTGLYDGMFLYNHLRLDERTVKRIFVWPSPSTAPAEDTRQRRTTVCFFAFDRYMATVYPFHCIRIELIEPRIVKWCDHFTPGMNATMVAPADSVHAAYLGEETCIPLCVLKSDMRKQYKGSLDIRMVDTAYAAKFSEPNVSVASFAYPYDEVNFPSTGSLIDINTGEPNYDPHFEKYCFTPTLGMECAYTVCFQGIDLDTVEANDADEAVLEYTNVRCMKIEVRNTVLEFTGGEYAAVPTLSAMIEPMAGMTMSAWLYPACSASEASRNITAFYFASSRTDVRMAMQEDKDKDYRVRNGVMYHQLAGESHGAFAYFDGWVGPVMSPAQYACDMWHYVAVTMTESGASQLVVDGIAQEAPLPGSRDVRSFSVTDFASKSRPDSLSLNNTGHFFIGYMPNAGWVGAIDELRVWNRALTLGEVKTDMHARVLDGSDATLKAYFQMRDGAGGSEFPMHDYSGNNNAMLGADSFNVSAVPWHVSTPPANASWAIPTIMPCVLGLQHTVGPTSGGCATEVYAWNAAPSPFSKCSINGVQTRATYTKAHTVSCTTPGHFTPVHAPVVASNDGTAFGTAAAASKEVTQLYMDSVLYVRDRDSTAEMDGVCYDLPDRSVTFSAWVCPGCTLPDPPAPTGNNRTGSYELDLIRKAEEAAAAAAAANTTTTTTAAAGP